MQHHFRHINSYLLLLLVLVFSTPAGLFHHCKEINHIHGELSIETSHDHCQVCDLKTDNFESISDKIRIVVPPVYAEVKGIFLPMVLNGHRDHIGNRGPPVTLSL